MTNKSVKFSPELIPLVLSGEKTSTWRLFDDKDLKEGDIVDFIKRPELTKFAEAKLTSVIEKPLDKLTKEDKVGHESFSSDTEMYKTYSGYYNKPVGPETPIKIIRFKIVQLQK